MLKVLLPEFLHNAMWAPCASRRELCF